MAPPQTGTLLQRLIGLALYYYSLIVYVIVHSCKKVKRIIIRLLFSKQFFVIFS